MIVFLSNKLQAQDTKLPLTFLAPAIVKGKMYRFNKDTIVVSPKNYRLAPDNSVVYGSLYKIPDDNYFIDVLDKLHTCVRNHEYSINHRVIVKASPISFNTIYELDSLKYRESSPISVYAYMANLKHKKVKRIMQEVTSWKRLRIVNGVDKAFLKQIHYYLKGEM